MMPEDLIDVLEDLKHDLGKYLVLPLSMLSDDAGADAIIAAVEEGLLRTRRGPRGSQSARSLWEAFADEVGPAVLAEPAAVVVAQAVERALGWQDALSAPAPIVREQVVRDFRAVGDSMGAWLAELRRSSHG